jgi:hypothetical protein
MLSAKSKGPLFYAGVDVKISDQDSGEQHTVLGTRVWLGKGKNPSDPEVIKAMQQLAAEDITNKMAGLMP